MFIADTPFVVDLETVSVKQLVKMLIEARGVQSAAHIRTKLNARLESISGRRGNSAGRDRVLSNGHARAALNG